MKHYVNHKILSTQERSAIWVALHEGMNYVLEDHRFSVGALSRHMQFYELLLSSSFPSSLKSLTGKDTWLDAGAGYAKAPIDYLAAKGVAQCIALGLAIPDGAQEDVQAAVNEYHNFQYVETEISQLNPKVTGDVALITDLYGPMTYVDPLVVLRKYFGLMKVDGILYCYLGKDNYVQTDGGKVKLIDWLYDVFGRDMGIGFMIIDGDNDVREHRISLMKTSIELELPELKLTEILYTGQGTPKRTFS